MFFKYTGKILPIIFVLFSSCHLILPIKDNVAVCGNGVIEAGEDCDTDAVPEDCNSLGLGSGTLKCDANCHFDTALCGQNLCGNGNIDTGEDCDLNNVPEDCSSIGLGEGPLTCDPGCHFNTSLCEQNLCGNGVIDDNEECDGTDIILNYCSEAGYWTGEVTCLSDCHMDTSDCSNVLFENQDSLVFNDIITDAFGNIYVTGSVATSFDGNEAMGGKDVLIIKYDEYGYILWSRQIGTSYDDEGFAITLEPSDSYLYVAIKSFGSFEGMTNYGGSDVYVMKLETSLGAVLWTGQYATGNNEVPSGIVVNGNVFVTGYVNNGEPLDKKSRKPIAGPNTDVFVAKFDNDNGNLMTDSAFGSAFNDYATAIISSSSNLFITGYTNGSMASDTTVTNLGYTDVFVSKLTLSASLIWTEQWGSSEYDFAKAFAINDGKIFVTGYTEGDWFGETNLGLKDAFVTCLDVSTGNWSFCGNKLIGSFSDDEAVDIIVNADDTGYVHISIPGYSYSDESTAESFVWSAVYHDFFGDYNLNPINWEFPDGSSSLNTRVKGITRFSYSDYFYLIGSFGNEDSTWEGSFLQRYQ